MRCIQRVSFPLFLVLLLFCWAANGKPKDPEFTERLKGIFTAALREHPNLELPNLQFPEAATVDEKAAYLAVHVAGLAAPELNALLGENGELLVEIRQALKVRDKKSRAERLLAALKKLFQNLARVVPKRKKTCKEAKAAGMTPEARLGHSPIPLFGFPVYSQEHRMTVLERRLPLNKLNRQKIGIKVGSVDYVIQGSVKKVLEFLDCFEDYTVTAQTLFPDGHWYSEPQDGQSPRPLYLQIQGSMREDSVAEILIRAGLERVVREVDVSLNKKGSLLALVEEALRGELTAVEYLKSKGAAATLKNLRAYARVQGSEFLALVKDVADAPTFESKLDALYKHLSHAEGGAEDWTQPWTVKHHERITLTFTTYPRPDHNNKSTKMMPGPQAKLKDIAKAVREIKWEW